MRIVKENNPRIRNSKKITIIAVVLGIVVAILIILIHIFPIKIAPYNIDNYRYIFSALLQVIGSIFAFIASSTLVVLQLLHTDSPNGVRLFPKSMFISFLVVTALVLAIDTLVLMYLSVEISLPIQIFFNGLIISNLFPILLACFYTVYVMKYLTPGHQIIRIALNCYAVAPDR